MVSNPDFYVELGRKIRDLRDRRGLSQEQLGLRLQPVLKRGSISAIETAKQTVMAHHIAQLCQILDVGPDEFFPKRQRERSFKELLAEELPPKYAREVAQYIERHEKANS